MVNILLGQNIFAEQGDDGWTNILFVVVMAVLWVIGGVIKATNQKSQNNRRGQAPQEPVPRIPKPTWDRKPMPKRPATPARAQATKPAAYPRKAFRPESMYAAKRTQPSPPKPQAGPIFENLPVVAGLPPTQAQPIQTGIPELAPKTETLPELILDFTDPDELSKAILHYEILGPPVSLRQPSHQSINF